MGPKGEAGPICWLIQTWRAFQAQFALERRIPIQAITLALQSRPLAGFRTGSCQLYNSIHNACFGKMS